MCPALDLLVPPLLHRSRQCLDLGRQPFQHQPQQGARCLWSQILQRLSDRRGDLRPAQPRQRPGQRPGQRFWRQRLWHNLVHPGGTAGLQLRRLGMGRNPDDRQRRQPRHAAQPPRCLDARYAGQVHIHQNGVKPAGRNQLQRGFAAVRNHGPVAHGGQKTRRNL